MENYIDDGYTESGFIAAVPGLHAEFRFEFRPMLPEERARLQDQGEKQPGDQFDRTCAAAVAPKIVSWSLVDRKGQPVEISAKSILRMRPALWGKLFNIVGGYRASDDDPNGPNGVQKQEADAKNSAAE